MSARGPGPYQGKPAPSPDTAVRLTAREAVHAAFVAKVVSSRANVGVPYCVHSPLDERPPQSDDHSQVCDALTAAIEARDRSHTDELREVAEMVRAVLDPEKGFTFVDSEENDLRHWLTRYDERTHKGQP